MSSENPGPETPNRRAERGVWLSRVALFGYLLLLATPWLRPVGRWAVGGDVFDLRTDARVSEVARRVALQAMVELARFAPLGALLVLCLVRREHRWTRALAAGAATLLLSAALTIAVMRYEIGAWPGPFDLILPLLGCTLGAWAASAWRLGVRRPLVLTLSGLGLAPIAAVVALACLAAEAEPLPFAAEHVDSAGKRRLYSLFRAKNPKEIPPGETRSLELTEHDVDLLLAWTLPLVAGEGRAKGRVDFSTSGSATAELSVRLPLRGDASPYLNVIAGCRPELQRGRLHLHEPRLRLGRVELPPFLLGLLSPLAARFLDQDRRLGPLLDIVQSMAIDEDKLRVSYGRATWPPGMLAGLIWGSGDEMRLEVSACSEYVLNAAPGFPKGDARFGAALETAFAWASDRSSVRSPVEANRTALLALGILLGHWRIQQFVGSVLDHDDWRRAAGLAEATLRGRQDWTKHFFVSAALTVLSSQAPSDAAGLFKEELDADGGSGFSFGDLTADRAGTSFALAATRDNGAARAVQERIAAGFRVDDFFPDAADLPEGIPDAELRSRYGGVGGPLYRDFAAEIERRLMRCAAYRDAPPAP